MQGLGRIEWGNRTRSRHYGNVGQEERQSYIPKQALQNTNSSFKSLGVTMGYLGFRDPPACILPKISSERVSWLDGAGIKGYHSITLLRLTVTHIW